MRAELAQSQREQLEPRKSELQRKRKVGPSFFEVVGRKVCVKSSVVQWGYKERLLVLPASF